jgi:hypothetical protein
MISDLRQSPQRMDSLWLCTAFHCLNQGWDRCAADLDQRVDGCTPSLDEDREPALMHATKMYKLRCSSYPISSSQLIRVLLSFSQPIFLSHTSCTVQQRVSGQVLRPANR